MVRACFWKGTDAANTLNNHSKLCYRNSVEWYKVNVIRKAQFLSCSHFFAIVMGRTPFYRTSNGLEHHFSNIERTRTCSSENSRTSNRLRTFYLNKKCTLFIVSVTFSNSEMGWLIKSDLGNSYQVSYATLCRIICMKYIFQVFQNWKKSLNSYLK